MNAIAQHPKAAHVSRPNQDHFIACVSALRAAGYRRFVADVLKKSSHLPRYFGYRPKIMSEADLKAELERLRAENEALKSRGSRGVSLKVSEKGAVSVYGMGRFPVTLYQEQWLKLLDMSDEIRTFIKDNESKLKKKE